MSAPTRALTLILPVIGWHRALVTETEYLTRTGLRSTAYVAQVRPGVSIVVSRVGGLPTPHATLAVLDDPLRVLPVTAARRCWELARKCVQVLPANPSSGGAS